MNKSIQSFKFFKYIYIYMITSIGILEESHFARDIIGGMLKPEASDRLTMEEVVRCIRKKVLLFLTFFTDKYA